jgi:hypothetical protein
LLANLGPLPGCAGSCTDGGCEQDSTQALAAKNLATFACLLESAIPQAEAATASETNTPVVRAGQEEEQASASLPGMPLGIQPFAVFAAQSIGAPPQAPHFEPPHTAQDNPVLAAGSAASKIRVETRPAPAWTQDGDEQQPTGAPVTVTQPEDGTERQTATANHQWNSTEAGFSSPLATGGSERNAKLGPLLFVTGAIQAAVAATISRTAFTAISDTPLQVLEPAPRQPLPVAERPAQAGVPTSQPDENEFAAFAEPQAKTQEVSGEAESLETGNDEASCQRAPSLRQTGAATEMGGRHGMPGVRSTHNRRNVEIGGTNTTLVMLAPASHRGAPGVVPPAPGALWVVKPSGSDTRAMEPASEATPSEGAFTPPLILQTAIPEVQSGKAPKAFDQTVSSSFAPDDAATAASLATKATSPAIAGAALPGPQGNRSGIERGEIAFAGRLTPIASRQDQNGQVEAVEPEHAENFGLKQEELSEAAAPAEAPRRVWTAAFPLTGLKGEARTAAAASVSRHEAISVGTVPERVEDDPQPAISGPDTESPHNPASRAQAPAVASKRYFNYGDALPEAQSGREAASHPATQGGRLATRRQLGESSSPSLKLPESGSHVREYVVHEPPSSTTTGSLPLRQIRLQVGASQGMAVVEVRLKEQSSQVDVSVRTRDSELAQSLRQDLPELAGRLGRHGFEADIWSPEGGVSRTQPDQWSLQDRAYKPAGESSGDSGTGRGHQGSQEQKQSGREEPAPEWAEELVRNLGPRTDQTGRSLQ